MCHSDLADMIDLFVCVPCTHKRVVMLTGSALQNLSADEEVLEKEYEGIPRLKSTLKIKSKPKTKHQKGTYRRGRNLTKTNPTSNDSRVLGATMTAPPFQSESFDLDLSEWESVDDPLPGQSISNLEIQSSEGSVLAPSQAQQDRYSSQSAEASSRKGLSRRTGSVNDSKRAGDQGGSAQQSDEIGTSEGNQEGAGASGSSRQTASSSLATRDAGDQADANVQEHVPEQQQGYSLMWCVVSSVIE